MFRKRKDKFTSPIDMKEHLREFVYDTQLVEAERLAVLLGATPISPEGEEHARSLSEDRLDKIAYLIPIIHSYAHILTTAMIKLERDDAEGDEETQFPDVFWKMMHALIEQISIAVTIGVVSQSVNLGLMRARER